MRYIALMALPLLAACQTCPIATVSVSCHTFTAAKEKQLATELSYVSPNSMIAEMNLDFARMRREAGCVKN